MAFFIDDCNQIRTGTEPPGSGDCELDGQGLPSPDEAPCLQLPISDAGQAIALELLRIWYGEQQPGSGQGGARLSNHPRRLLHRIIN